MRNRNRRNRLRAGMTAIALVLCLWLGSTGPAGAVTVGLAGLVDSADANPFGITTSTPVTGYATYDASLALSGGLLNYLDDPGMVFDFHVGSFSFNSATDAFYDLTFGITGGLANIALLFAQGSQGWGLDIAYDYPDGSNFFSMSDPGFDFIVTGQAAPVPIPGALLLLGSGLPLLVGMRWRMSKKGPGGPGRKIGRTSYSPACLPPLQS